MMPKPKVVVFDLDDTLYKEVDFLKSAYREIADFVEKKNGCSEVYDKMISWWKAGDNVFETLIRNYCLDVSIKELLDLYRQHFPQIQLDDETRNVLIRLRKTCKLGIISDGRSVTQRNKIKALGLSEYVECSDIYISEEVGHLKTAPYSFIKIMESYPDYQYVYVGDNPQKDFIISNQLRWDSFCLLDNGQHIHKQDFTQDALKMPKHIINNIIELLDYV